MIRILCVCVSAEGPLSPAVPAQYFAVRNAKTSIMCIRAGQKIASKILDNVLLIVIQSNIIERKGGMTYGIQNR
jgi:hypothetical protein